MVCNESNNNSYYYIQNLRGDVMMLVGSDGNASAIRDYDASGEMLSQAPRDRDPFGFTGGIDAGNGLWKLGARFYDSTKNSFIQQDRYMGDSSDPLSLNRYVYCGLDPVNYVDPTGFKPITYHVTDTLAVNTLSGSLGMHITSVDTPGSLILGIALSVNKKFPQLTILTTLLFGIDAMGNGLEAGLVSEIANSTYYTVEFSNDPGPCIYVRCYNKDGNPTKKGYISWDTYNTLMNNSASGSTAEPDSTGYVSATNSEF
jgi:RHS repeat-associated protein